MRNFLIGIHLIIALACGLAVAAATAQETGDKSSANKAQQDNQQPATEKQQEPPSADQSLKDKLGTPRRAVSTFLNAVSANNLNDAAICLDFSQLPVTEEARRVLEREYAVKLKGVLDKIALIQLEKIPDQEDYQQPHPVFTGHEIDGDARADAGLIVLSRSPDGLWRFSPDTVAAIEDLHQRWLDRKTVLGLFVPDVEPPTISMWLEKQFPENLRQTVFLLPTYKWICILGVFVLGLLADFLTQWLLRFLTSGWFYLTRNEPAPSQRGVWRPVGLLMQGVVWYIGTSQIGLPPTALSILLFALRIFAVVAAVWLAFRLIDFLAAVVRRRTQRTETRYDDLLVPLVSQTLKFIAIGIGLFICGRAFGLDWLSTVMAGLLAVGGMALAFASQDAVSNLFGTLTVLLDRPFKVGDWIVASDVEGTVEAVGFRSTRLRTFYNSVITLPNSKLTTAEVDNMGRRQFRRIKTNLGVQYDTTPEQIEAFCEGIRELIRRHPYTRKDAYHVYLNDFSGSSIDILLYCFLSCPDWSIELRERHRLLLDIVRLAKRLNVSFAFPTRTVHLYQEEHPPAAATLPEPLYAGQREAADIAGPLLTGKARPGPVAYEGPSDTR